MSRAEEKAEEERMLAQVRRLTPEERVRLKRELLGILRKAEGRKLPRNHLQVIQGRRGA